MATLWQQKISKPKRFRNFYNKWMSTTDGRAYDFMWKNFRLEKKIVPPEGKKDAKVGVIKCSGKDLLDDWYEQVYSFITQGFVLYVMREPKKNLEQK